MSGSTYRNGAGYYDPTVAEMFKREDKQKVIDDKQKRRDKQVRAVISNSLALLSRNDLKLMNRMVVKDNKTGKVYE